MPQSEFTRNYYIRKYKDKIVERACAHCGSLFIRAAREAGHVKFCSLKCRDLGLERPKGSANPNWRGGPKPCQVCGKPVNNRKKETRYCSRECFSVSGTAPLGRTDKNGNVVSGAVDANHAEIYAALVENGISVLDSSVVQGGFPDLTAAKGGRTVLLEVKNKKTSYGRRGLSVLQARFADTWPGDIFIVHSPAEALAVFGIGDGECPPNVSYFARLPEDERKRLKDEGLEIARRYMDAATSQPEAGDS